MKNNRQGKSDVNRRKLLPFLGSFLLLPFIGSSKSLTDIVEPDQSYQTMLTKDGKIVKVRSSKVNDSKVVDKQLSNHSLLKWLKKDNKLF
ncbi:MAG: hypothetical protein DRI71_03035 [Bacteroidetes bacterium]|nr:MAG: hypothetical protein DRI71_03035 [Bacteroidota bacterium]